jgi:hypothetical protein
MWLLRILESILYNKFFNYFLFIIYLIILILWFNHSLLFYVNNKDFLTDILSLLICIYVFLSLFSIFKISIKEVNKNYENKVEYVPSIPIDYLLKSISILIFIYIQESNFYTCKSLWSNWWCFLPQYIFTEAFFILIMLPWFIITIFLEFITKYIKNRKFNNNI